MHVIALVKGSFTVSSFREVTNIAVTSTSITITGILENSGSTTASNYTLARSSYIVRIMDN